MKGILLVNASLIVAWALLPLFSTTAKQEITLHDKDMTIASAEDLSYPLNAYNIQGVVVVQAKLDNNGKVVMATAVSGDERLIPDCLANTKKWRFQPNPQRAAIIVYNFRHTGSCKVETSMSTVQPPNFVSITGCDTPMQP